MARILTGEALECLIHECAEHMLDDPDVKSLMEELDNGISKLFYDINEEKKENLQIMEEIPELVKDMKVLAKRKKDDLWYDATILELLKNQLSQVKVKVKFDRKGSRGILSCKHIALKNKMNWKELCVGSRIIAKYDNDADSTMKQCLYAGIIAETPLPYNKHKFLVFFDDGFAQYMDCDNIYKVYEASNYVWEDVHEDSREFIKEYLDKYPERPMVRVTDGQVLKTEWKGRWWKTRVLKVHGSLVNMKFLIDERTEWIYRGSPRLEPLHRELMAAEASRLRGKVIRGTSHTVVKRNAPVVEYINVETPTLVNPEERSRQTARKSSKNRKQHRQRYHWVERERQWETNRPNWESNQGSNYTIYEDSDNNIVDDRDKYSSIQLNAEIVNQISSACDSSSEFEIIGFSKKTSKLPFASYEKHSCSCLCVVPVKNKVQDLKDENPLRWPQIVGWQRELSGKRGSGRKTVFYRTPCGKRLNKLKCPCQQLTIDATHASRDGKVDVNAGYKYRRLEEQLTTGIFECNSKCKCSKSCYNRVAQNGVRVRLQVFKTEKRGWGLRCIDDIPAGMFICTYAGNLWNEEEANDVGQKYGDEYFAELDYIEVVEKNKEGYESDVQSSEGYETESTNSSCNSDADYHTDSSSSSPHHIPSTDENSFDDGYAATQTESETRIVLRRKSATDGTCSTKDSWSVVDSPERIRTNCEITNKEQQSLSTTVRENIIIISSDEEDNASNSVNAAVKEASKCHQIITEECIFSVKDSKNPVTVEKIANEQNKLTLKNVAMEEISLINHANQNQENQENVTNLDYEDHQHLEKALADIFTGHTDDEEPIENIDKQDKTIEKLPDISTFGGINYGYNISPRRVLDSKAIFAYRERKRKKIFKSSGDTNTEVLTKLQTTERDLNKPIINVADFKASCTNTPPSTSLTSIEDLSPNTENLDSNSQFTRSSIDSTGEALLLRKKETSDDSFNNHHLAEFKETCSVVDSELSSSDSEDDKESVESADLLKKSKLKTAKKSTHTRLSLTKSPSYLSKETATSNLTNDYEVDEKQSFSRTRSLFREEHCYVMDAKKEGNLGRYFNHSCVPNLFVQNVFVDTHDLRFPWLAFFAGQNIRAGTELTWDYGYEVGSVANKTLYCYCGSVDCRGRLL
ncbi:histone-lysine N-methyltransferase SETDB1-like isoform X2 [Antedon mediterranea]|uniref:histone-lysine N-methyltransferase SETDB1-like isoform X2 n=1 Tax=Antedon mediterranea TaxID=105859 RepID=UPI003AF63D02